MITDDELLLYYYRELDAAERARIGAAISADPELARRLHALVARLDAAAAMPEVPVPAQAQERWRAALERAAVTTRAAPVRRRTFIPPVWFAAAATVAAVAIGLTIYKGTVRPDGSVDAQLNAFVNANPTPNQASPYENGLKVHLASTERRLASLSQATPEERARLVETIIEQNRMYALAAERANEPQLARVLRAFTPILENVAAGGGESTASEVAQLNFEMRVMQARLNANAPSQSL
jgi:hypothetical protein